MKFEYGLALEGETSKSMNYDIHEQFMFLPNFMRKNSHISKKIIL